MCARRSMPALPSSRFLSRHGRVERRRARTKTTTTNHRRPRFLGLFFQFLSTHLGVNFDHKKPERISSSAGSTENKQQELIKKMPTTRGLRSMAQSSFSLRASLPSLKILWNCFSSSLQIIQVRLLNGRNNNSKRVARGARTSFGCLRKNS